MNFCLPFGRSSKDLSVEELETSAGTNPRTSHHLSPGIGERSAQWPSMKRQERAVVSLTNIGTLSKPTLELFQGPHWNCFKGCFRGHIGTVSGATLELFHGPHWNCFTGHIGTNRGHIGTVSRATLELFQGPHWNCFRGNSGTFSEATLKLFQRQHWNSFKDSIWETSLMHMWSACMPSRPELCVPLQ